MLGRSKGTEIHLNGYKELFVVVVVTSLFTLVVVMVDVNTDMTNTWRITLLRSTVIKDPCFTVSQLVALVR